MNQQSKDKLKLEFTQEFANGYIISDGTNWEDVFDWWLAKLDEVVEEERERILEAQDRIINRNREKGFDPSTTLENITNKFFIDSELKNN